MGVVTTKLITDLRAITKYNKQGVYVPSMLIYSYPQCTGARLKYGICGGVLAQCWLVEVFAYHCCKQKQVM